MLGVRPSVRSRSLKATLVYCVPRSLWCTGAMTGRRRVMAISTAFTTSSVVAFSPMLQPTIFLSNASSTLAR